MGWRGNEDGGGDEVRRGKRGGGGWGDPLDNTQQSKQRRQMTRRDGILHPYPLQCGTGGLVENPRKWVPRFSDVEVER